MPSVKVMWLLFLCYADRVMVQKQCFEMCAHNRLKIMHMHITFLEKELFKEISTLVS